LSGTQLLTTKIKWQVKAYHIEARCKLARTSSLIAEHLIAFYKAVRTLQQKIGEITQRSAFFECPPISSLVHAFFFCSLSLWCSCSAPALLLDRDFVLAGRCAVFICSSAKTAQQLSSGGSCCRGMQEDSKSKFSSKKLSKKGSKEITSSSLRHTTESSARAVLENSAVFQQVNQLVLK
jgi:hypothetical protein